MNSSTTYSRVLCLHAAAKRLQIPERTLRYQASRGWIQGAFKQGKRRARLAHRLHEA